MNKISEAFCMFKKDRIGLIAILFSYFSFLFPERIYLSLMFRLKMGYWINWDNPKTFSEKLQWLKLYDRKSEYTMMVDKYAVKDYVANKIGEEYIIPTLGVWSNPNEIDWNLLPNKFVLKTTHGGGSGGVVICCDKNKFNKKAAIDRLKRNYKQCIYRKLREWPYKDVPRRVIAEKFMEESHSKKNNVDLSDYKFFCFNGKPTYCQVIRDRRSHETIDFYDMDWNHMPFVGLNPVINNGSSPVINNGSSPVIKPTRLNEMIDICKKISRNLVFSRIDLYVIDEKIYFGEITFYPASGFGEFTPNEWNVKLGNLINLYGIIRN